MKKLFVNGLYFMFLTGFSVQSYSHDVELYAQDITMAVELRKYTNECYRKLDKDPNGDYGVSEFDLYDCVLKAWKASKLALKQGDNDER